ncbi:hypothetical protein [Halosimplex sp. TS25]|uniref:hypothetical protein n=1 Tax=Halosimplex rarum TaxID=3396619 RepID=UPI0039E8BD92
MDGGPAADDDVDGATETDDGGNYDASNMGVGIAIGVALGASFGVAFDNLALGMGMGIAIGVAIGAGMDQAETKED